MKNTKTYSAKPTEVERKWLLVDASENTLGRVATVIAGHLTGKNKPIFTANIDCGDFVVVVNAENLKVTGGKMLQKKYYRHSQYPGALRTADLKSKMDKGESAWVIENAVRGMLPKNKLQTDRMKRLKVYTGAEHEHQAQDPRKVEVK